MSDALENDVRVVLGAVFAEMDRLRAENARLKDDLLAMGAAAEAVVKVKTCCEHC